MYECLTAGTVPYTGLSNKMVILSVVAGSILPPPKVCPPALYAVLVSCLKFRPQMRSDFATVLRDLCEVGASGIFDSETTPPPSREDVVHVEVDAKTNTCKYTYLDDTDQFDKCMVAVVAKYPEFKADRASKIATQRLAPKSSPSAHTAAIKHARADLPKESAGHFTDKSAEEKEPEAGYGQVQQFAGTARKTSLTHEKLDAYEYACIVFDQHGRLQLSELESDDA